MRSTWWPMTMAGMSMAARWLTVGAMGPARMPWSTAAVSVGSLDSVFITLSTGPLPVRGSRRNSDAVRRTRGRAKCTASSIGMKVMAAAGTAHSSTGISMTRPWTRSGAMAATSRLTFPPRDTPPITALSMPRWSSRATTCSA